MQTVSDIAQKVSEQLPFTMSNIPKTRKVGVYVKAGDLQIKEVPVEMPKEGEVLIKSLACGVCHSDHLIGTGGFGDVL